MHKLKMKATKGLTFEEGCNKYLEYCRQRNLRQGTINHNDSIINNKREFYECFRKSEEATIGQLIR